MIKCVIFDLDDTLSPEINYCKSGFQHIASYIQREVGVDSKLFFESVWADFNAGNRDQLFNRTLEKFNIDYDDQFIKNLVNEYRSHQPDIQLPEDSRDILKTLSGEYTLALLSDGFLPAQKLKVEALGIAGYFRKIVYTEELGREFWKPSTVGFEQILKELDISPQEAVYIGDNIKKDFIPTNKLGMHSVQLMRPEKVHQDTAVDSIAKPEKVVNHLSQLPEILKEI